MGLKNKRILITAGPTWVRIDAVRVISNIATGETGILLAKELARLGAKVTLLLGPVNTCTLNRYVKLMRFTFFDELKDLITKQVKSGKFDIVVHSAAVADYKPQISRKKKIKSGIKEWALRLSPTPKIIDLIKKIDRNLFLVGFKFEPECGRKKLISQAKKLIKRAKLSLAVANTVDRGRYEAYIVGKNIVKGPIAAKKALVNRLIREISLNC